MCVCVRVGVVKGSFNWDGSGKEIGTQGTALSACDSATAPRLLTMCTHPTHPAAPTQHTRAHSPINTE